MKKTTHKVTAKQSGARLDVFVSEELGITRSQVQKLLEADLVLKNDTLPKKGGDRVKEGDTIVISNGAKRKEKSLPPSSAKSPTSNDSSSPTGSLEMTKLEPTIVAETPDYVVINKPTGLLAHPTMAKEKNTLTAWLVKKYPKIKKVGDDPTVRPGIVHRLDKEASGLMVVAKTQPMFDHLKDQFKSRSVEKEYLALVHGKVVKNWDEITFPIARSETFDRMAARPLLASKNVGSRQWTDEENEPSDEISVSKDAKTEFIVEKSFANCTLLRVILHTGRMHQIRVHMLAYNHPLVGDPLYSQKKRKRNLDEKCGRLFLHSTKLAFTDLSGDKQTFEAPLPPMLSSFINELH